MQKSAQRTVEAQAIHLTTLMCLCFINAFFFFFFNKKAPQVEGESCFTFWQRGMACTKEFEK